MDTSRVHYPPSHTGTSEFLVFVVTVVVCFCFAVDLMAISTFSITPHCALMLRADREGASCFPGGHSYAAASTCGNFQHCHPAAIVLVGLPVSQMRKYPLTSERGPVLTPLQSSRGSEGSPRAHKDEQWPGKSFPCSLWVKRHGFPPPHLGTGQGSLDPPSEHPEANHIPKFQPCVYVTLTEFWRTVTGNVLLGMELKKSRKVSLITTSV